MSAGRLCNHETASHLARQIELAGAKSTDRVTLLGCQQIEMLVELLSRGFLDVTCRTLRGPGTDSTPADLVVAPSVIDETELLELLSRLDRGLRPGGTLFVGTAALSSAQRKQRLHELLRRHGFAFTPTVVASGETAFLCCRKLSMLQAQAA